MKVMVLAGTQEARALAGLLAAAGVEATASLAGVTKSPAPLPIPMRVGGFGGRAAQIRHMKEGGFDAVIDATHPFAAKIPARSLEVSRLLGLPHLRLLRAPWMAGPGDRWHGLATPEDAPAVIRPGARVFLATGAQSLDRWAALAEGRHLLCRRVDATKTPFPFTGDWIIGRPPFGLGAEIDLLKTHQIDWIVAKNAGGPARAKLDAARHLGVPVALLDRPAPLVCDHAQTAGEAMAWLTRLNG